MPHRILRRDPGAAGHGPARTGLDGKPQAQAVGLAGQMGDQFLPLGSQRPNLPLRCRPGAAEVPVEPLDSGNSGIRDGLQVGVDPFAGHIAADEVEPGLWIKHLFRRLEPHFIHHAEGGAQQRRIRNDVRRLFSGRVRRWVEESLPGQGSLRLSDARAGPGPGAKSQKKEGRP